MNNENKRFKQINRVVTPINVVSKEEALNKNAEAERKNQEPKKRKKISMPKIPIDKDKVILGLIIVFAVLSIGAFIFLIIPTDNKTKLEYNDKTNSKSDAQTYYFTSKSLSDDELLENNQEYQVNSDFKVSYINKNLLVNGVNVLSNVNVSSEFGLVDDLLMFTTESGSVRTKVFYAVDKTGMKVLELYHIGNINGMVIESTPDAVTFNPLNLIIKTSNVLNDTILANNVINEANPVTICDEELMFASSIATGDPVKIYYSYEYVGNHEFKSTPIYKESLKTYIETNGYCKAIEEQVS